MDTIKILIVTLVSFFVLSTHLMAHDGNTYTGIAETINAPGSVSDVWKEIKGQERQLGQLISAGQFDQAHQVGFQIRYLTMALYEKSRGLSLVKINKVHVSVDEIEQIANRLSQYKNPDDRSKIEAEFAKLQQALRKIKEQYPRRALPKE